ncbi:CPBP family intramembrane glutamic endopeptidase [Tellurirhabdus bombi]|uniref:CPBP family intramembrane glutamic endopeptidase n=1 Tax=Tellurirhabdus bombi TaxID=2907205 RepID=UPI001F1630F4|nr:CPBP family intramembrane glutamic endopeptidase [Tellurirhabdus bombi]
MTELRSNNPLAEGLHPLRSIILLLGFVLVGMSLGSIVSALLLVIWSTMQDGGAARNTFELLSNPEAFSGSWYLLILIQGISHALTFLVPCLLYWRMMERRRWKDFNPRPLSTVNSLALVVLLTIAFMPFNGLIIEWNQNINLPPAFEGLEEWMKQKEDQLTKLTTFLVSFDSPVQLMLALVVVGALPGIGEEVLFRGLLQRKLGQWTGNTHAAIWIAAAIFSAIHFQFYGFFPRMLLGALFGYLYAWSGNLWVPILAHFVNNGFTVLMVWLYRQRVVPIDIENTNSVPLTGAFFSLLLTIGLLYYFRKSNQAARSHPYG